MTEEMTEQEKQEQIIERLFSKVKILESRILQIEAWKNEYLLPHYRTEEDHTTRNRAIVIIIAFVIIAVILYQIRT